MIRNYQKNGADINLTPIYQSISGLKSNIAELESLTTLSSLTSDILNLNSSLSGLNDSIISLNNDVLNINSSLSDITNSLSTLTGGGGFTAPYYNNQAFNTTLNFYSDMFFTGIFSLPSSNAIMTYDSGYWNLSELKSMRINNITVSSLKYLYMDDFFISRCYFTCESEYFNSCIFRVCTLKVESFGKFENCNIGYDVNFAGKDLEFNSCTFSSDPIDISRCSRLSFKHIDFHKSFMCYLLFNNYRVYLHDCLINGNTFETSTLSNMFICSSNLSFIVL